MSASPGETNLPARSMRRAPAGIGVAALSPSATIRRSDTTRVWSRSTRSESIGTTLACTKATAAGGDAARAPAGSARRPAESAAASFVMPLSTHGTAPGSPREVLRPGSVERDPEKADQDASGGVARPVRAEIDAAGGHGQHAQRADRERAQTHRALAAPVEDDGHEAAEEHRRHGRVPAREAVGRLLHERGPERRTGPAEDELQ